MIASGIPDASADAHGLMSAADYLKLAGITGSNTGDVTIGSPANGLSIAGQVLSLALAAAGQAGAVSTAAQVFDGLKTFTNGVRMPAGSLSAVAFGPSGDDDNGINFPASDTINVVTGGVLRAQFDSAGVAWITKQLKLDSAGRVINLPQLVLPGGAGGYGYGGGLELGGTFNGLHHNGSKLYLQAYGSGVTANLEGFLAGAVVAGFTGANLASGDVAVKVGTAGAQANLNASSKLLSVRDTLGGVENEYAYVRPIKADGSSAFGAVLTVDSKNRTHVGGLHILNEGAGDTGIFFGSAGGAGGATMGNGSIGTRGLLTNVTNRGQSWYINSGAFSGSARAMFDWEGVADANQKTLPFTRFQADAAHTAEIGRWLTGSVQVFGLDKDGNPQLTMAGAARPTANASNRGKLWYGKSAGGVADTLEVCLKDAADAYSWKTLATG